MAHLGHKAGRKGGKWLSVLEYAKRHGIKNPEILYVRMLKGQVVWREVEIVVKRKQIFNENV